jgi:hypothetical protein
MDAVDCFHLSPATQKALTNIREYLAGHLPEGPPNTSNTFTSFTFVALAPVYATIVLVGAFQPPAGHVVIEHNATVGGSKQVGTVSLDLTSGDFSASWKPDPNPVEPNPAPIHVSGTVNCVASHPEGSGTSYADFLFVIPQETYGGTSYILMTSNNSVPVG